MTSREDDHPTFEYQLYGPGDEDLGVHAQAWREEAGEEWDSFTASDFAAEELQSRGLAVDDVILPLDDSTAHSIYSSDDEPIPWQHRDVSGVIRVHPTRRGSFDQGQQK